jgi:hypothetical protein
VFLFSSRLGRLGSLLVSLVLTAVLFDRFTVLSRIDRAAVGPPRTPTPADRTFGAGGRDGTMGAPGL